MRYFNTSGQCVPQLHYMLPAEERLPEAREFIDRGQYFVVYAPPRTGRTMTLTAMASQLTTEGRYAALRFSCEAAGAFDDDFGGAENVMLEAVRDAAKGRLPEELRPPDSWPDAPPGSLLIGALSAWAQGCPRPLVLFFDDIDALRGMSLISVLSQLRDGYTGDKAGFVHSVVLCGLRRRVRNYTTGSGNDSDRPGSPVPFNITVASLRLGDFTPEEVAELYGQHTAETGQEFTKDAIERAFTYTQGQPWLVNALAYEIIMRMRIRPPTTITAEHVDEAKERLILTRATHLDSLADKLHEPRVRRVIAPMIAGSRPENDPTYNDDVAYARDLGLVGPGRPPSVANPIYREVIVRVLGELPEFLETPDPHGFVRPDGQLDIRRLLEEFAAFWCEHGEILGTYYLEAAPHLVLTGFLQRVVNGGGYVDREYATGRGRTDIVIRKPYTDADGTRRLQRAAIELKVWREGRPDPLPEGLEQLDGYLDRLGLDTGTLIIFDSRPDSAPLRDRIAFSDATAPSGRTITLLRA